MPLATNVNLWKKRMPYSDSLSCSLKTLVHGSVFENEIGRAELTVSMRVDQRFKQLVQIGGFD